MQAKAGGPRAKGSEDWSQPSTTTSRSHPPERPASPLWQAGINIPTEQLARAPVRTTRSRSRRTRSSLTAPAQATPEIIQPQRLASATSEPTAGYDRHPGARDFATALQQASFLDPTGRQRPHSLPPPGAFPHTGQVPHRSSDPSPLDLLTSLPTSHASAYTSMLAPTARPPSTQSEQRQPWHASSTASDQQGMYPPTGPSDQQRAVHSILQLLMQQQRTAVSQFGQTSLPHSSAQPITNQTVKALGIPFEQGRSADYNAAVEPSRGADYRTSSAADFEYFSQPAFDASQSLSRLAQPHARLSQSQAHGLASPYSSAASMQLSSALSQPNPAPSWGQLPRQAHPLMPLSDQAYADIDQSMVVAQQSLFDAVIEELAKEDGIAPPTTTTSGFGWS